VSDPEPTVRAPEIERKKKKRQRDEKRVIIKDRKDY
jgi:hypothetical protein